jgi:hypothetical protein
MTESKKYISSFYDTELPLNYISRGYYGYAQCRGCCDWTITDIKTIADNWCIPYTDKKYVYIFQFYGDIENTLLYSLMNYIVTYLKVQTVKANENTYVILSDDLILNMISNRPESILPSDINMKYLDTVYPDDPDEMGGIIEYIDLTLQNPDI